MLLIPASIFFVNSWMVPSAASNSRPTVLSWGELLPMQIWMKRVDFQANSQLLSAPKSGKGARKMEAPLEAGNYIEKEGTISGNFKRRVVITHKWVWMGREVSHCIWMV